MKDIMCTGFFKKSSDIIFGYNFDIDLNVWDYKIIANGSVFSIAIKIGSKTYLTHGVTKDGCFACLPYMNDLTPFVKMKGTKRIDLLVNDYLKGKITFNDIQNIMKNNDISNIKFGSLHALIGNNNGKTMIVEPGVGYKENDTFSVITNYPLLKECLDDNSFYGKDRYKIVYDYLQNHKELNYMDALSLLKKVAQDGTYGTRLSFVYSKNDNCVYYIENNDGIIKNIYFKCLLNKCIYKIAIIN